MKRNNVVKFTLIAILAAVLVVSSFLIFQFLSSSKKIEIKYASDVKDVSTKLYAIEVEDDDYNPEYSVKPDNLVFETKGSTEAELKKRSYIKVVEGEGYVKTLEKIVVDENLDSIFIDPSYTDEKLNSLLDSEYNEIAKTINDNVITPPDSIKIDRGKLYGNGEWYGTTIIENQTAEQQRLNYSDVYRAVLNKRAGKWFFVGEKPELILSKEKYKDVPIEILIDINKMVPQ